MRHCSSSGIFTVLAMERTAHGASVKMFKLKLHIAERAPSNGKADDMAPYVIWDDGPRHGLLGIV